MRIEIKPSALDHQITDPEIRTLVNHPALRISLTPRIPSAVPVLFIGPPAINEPWIEVIADFRRRTVAEVFHAMMLRPTLVASLGLDDLITPEYAQQRA
jgi:hypothetical protein